MKRYLGIAAACLAGSALFNLCGLTHIGYHIGWGIVVGLAWPTN